MTTPEHGTAGGAATVRPLASYLVLMKSGNNTWSEVGPVAARDPEAAVKAVVSEMHEDDQSGVFVAVVASRWNPVAITAKVERSLELKPVAK